MDLAGLLVFAAAYLMAIASPGPGVAAVVARALARGPAGSAGFIAGFVLGDLLWFAVAASGFALLAEAFAALFTAIRYAGAAYLLFLAWKLWTAPAVPAADAPPPELGAPAHQCTSLPVLPVRRLGGGAGVLGVRVRRGAPRGCGRVRPAARHPLTRPSGPGPL